MSHITCAAHPKRYIHTLQWRHNGRDGISNHQPHHCLLNRLFRHRSKKTSKVRVTGLCAGNSPVTGEFPAQMASNAENVSVWWLHHEFMQCCGLFGFVLISCTHIQSWTYYFSLFLCFYWCEVHFLSSKSIICNELQNHVSYHGTIVLIPV